MQYAYLLLILLNKSLIQVSGNTLTIPLAHRRLLRPTGAERPRPTPPAAAPRPGKAVGFLGRSHANSGEHSEQRELVGERFPACAFVANVVVVDTIARPFMVAVARQVLFVAVRC